jgi:hypothetical protein
VRLIKSSYHQYNSPAWLFLPQAKPITAAKFINLLPDKVPSFLGNLIITHVDWELEASLKK